MLTYTSFIHDLLTVPVLITFLGHKCGGEIEEQGLLTSPLTHSTLLIIKQELFSSKRLEVPEKP